MDREELDALPCPFCGNLPMVFQYNGTMQARCQGAYGDCAGTDVIAPIGMWNKRSAADLLDQQAARIAELEAERDAAIRALSEEGRLRGAAEARADAAWCAGRDAAAEAVENAPTVNVQAGTGFGWEVLVATPSVPYPQMIRALTPPEPRS